MWGEPRVADRHAARVTEMADSMQSDVKVEIALSPHEPGRKSRSFSTHKVKESSLFSHTPKAEPTPS